MNDLPLFRQSDPDTSREAADAVAPKLGRYQLEYLRRNALLGEATAGEVAQGNESIRKRKAELVRCGRLIRTGSRTCRMSGKRAETFKVST